MNNKKQLLLETFKTYEELFNVSNGVPKTYILGLTYCDKCKELQETFKSKNINYTFIDADLNNDFSDEIENITGNDYYPMVIVYNGLLIEIYDVEFKSLI